MSGEMRQICILAGKSHPRLSQEIAKRLGLSLGEVVLGKFSNQETFVEIKQSVRDHDVFIFQSGCGSVNDHLMELLIMVDGCRRASAKRITVVIPCFPYARQPDIRYLDHHDLNATPGTLIAHMLQSIGANHVITVDNLISKPLMCKVISETVREYRKAVIVSPDAGGAKRASAIADQLGMEFALIHKTCRKQPNEEMDLILVGEVTHRVVIIIDDILDTATTLLQAAKILTDHQAQKIIAIITHGIFSGNAIELINESSIDLVIVSNTIPQEEHMLVCPKICTFDVGPIFAEAIRRIHHGESISYLFEQDHYS
jgi:ribose-phosphate pyrophosphokinase